MRYLTDRKRAEGLGAGRAGTHHHWRMTKSSAALIVLIPLFVITFAPMLGRPFEEVTVYYARPFPALVAALTFLVGMMHFKDGAQIMLEDYVHGRWGRFSIFAATGLAWTVAAVGVFAVLRLAL